MRTWWILGVLGLLFTGTSGEAMTTISGQAAAIPVERGNGNQERGGDASQSKTHHQEKEISTAKPINLDLARTILERSHDFAGAEEPNEEQLARMASDPDRQDYGKVIEEFTQSRLHGTLVSYHTVGESVNPRKVLAVTKEGMIYLLFLQKNYRYGGIWLVTKYSEAKLPEEGEGLFPAYRVVTLEEAPSDIQRWADAVLSEPDGKQEWRISGDKTYVLLKVPSCTTDSVELAGIQADAGELYVKIQTTEWLDDAESDLIQPYMVVEIDFESPFSVQFQEIFHR